MTSLGRSGEVGDLVGVELLGGGDQLVAVHRLDEGLAHRVGDLEQDLAVALGLDQVPDEEALVERQRLEDVGDVGRVQLVQLGAQLGDVLLVHQVLDQLVARHLLAVHQALDDAMARQQLLHLAQFLLDVLALAEILDVGHGTTAMGAAGREAAADGGL
jgi:hypothetical protein